MMIMGMIILWISIVAFIVGFVLALVFDNKLANDGVEYVINMTEKDFQKFCFGMESGLVLMIFGIVVLPVGIILTVL